MFLSLLFIISNNRIMLNVNVVYIHNGILFSSKKDQIFAVKWMELEDIMLSRTNLSWKGRYHRVFFMDVISIKLL